MSWWGEFVVVGCCKLLLMQGISEKCMELFILNESSQDSIFVAPGVATAELYPVTVNPQEKLYLKAKPTKSTAAMVPPGAHPE